MQGYAWSKSQDAQDGGEEPDGYPRPESLVASEPDEEFEDDYADTLAWLEERNGRREIRGLKPT